VSHPITVLVVDDSDDILEVLEMALEAAGYRVIVAGDAVHAFELVRGERPHVLLTDIMLGVTSGLDLITRVRSDLAPPLPAIIAMSGFGDVAREALRRGAGSFIPKPFVVDDLLDTIAAAADGRAPTPSTQQHAADAARHQRSVAAAAADAALARLAPVYPEMQRRTEWTVNWAPAYLGFGHAFVAVVREGRLRVVAASEGAPVDLDSPVGERVPLVRDIVETASSIVLSGHGAPAFGTMQGFFAGVPLRIGKVAIGAFCVVDERPHALGSEDFEVMQAWGRRASAVLADEPHPPQALWAPLGLISESGYALLLSALLRRCQSGTDALHVIMIECARPPAEWRDELAEAMGRDHCCIADLENGRYGVVVARPDKLSVRAAAGRALAAWASRADARAGMITVDNAAVIGVGEQEVSRLAEAALARALARRDEGVGRIERFTLGRAAPSTEEAPRAPAYEARKGV